MPNSPAREFIAHYQEKGYIILKAILDAYNTSWAGPRLGDFSYRQIRENIEKYGVSYNPSPLLRKLEKEYGLIETTYHSSNQHWWRILNLKDIESAIKEYEGIPENEEEEDYRARMLRIQFLSLNPEKTLETLLRLSRKRRLSTYEKQIIQRIVFDDLPRIIDFLEQATAEYPDELSREISLAETILSTIEKLVTSQHKRRTTTRDERIRTGNLAGLENSPRRRFPESF